MFKILKRLLLTTFTRWTLKSVAYTAGLCHLRALYYLGSIIPCAFIYSFFLGDFHLGLTLALWGNIPLGLILFSWLQLSHNQDRIDGCLARCWPYRLPLLVGFLVLPQLVGLLSSVEAFGGSDELDRPPLNFARRASIYTYPEIPNLNTWFPPRVGPGSQLVNSGFDGIAAKLAVKIHHLEVQDNLRIQAHNDLVLRIGKPTYEEELQKLLSRTHSVNSAIAGVNHARPTQNFLAAARHIITQELAKWEESRNQLAKFVFEDEGLQSMRYSDFTRFTLSEWSHCAARHHPFVVARPCLATYKQYSDNYLIDIVAESCYTEPRLGLLNLLNDDLNAAYKSSIRDSCAPRFFTRVFNLWFNVPNTAPPSFRVLVEKALWVLDTASLQNRPISKGGLNHAFPTVNYAKPYVPLQPLTPALEAPYLSETPYGIIIGAQTGLDPCTWFNSTAFCHTPLSYERQLSFLEYLNDQAKLSRNYSNLLKDRIRLSKYASSYDIASYNIEVDDYNTFQRRVLGLCSEEGHRRGLAILNESLTSWRANRQGVLGLATSFRTQHTCARSAAESLLIEWGVNLSNEANSFFREVDLLDVANPYIIERYAHLIAEAASLSAPVPPRPELATHLLGKCIAHLESSPAPKLLREVLDRNFAEASKTAPPSYGTLIDHTTKRLSQDSVPPPLLNLGVIPKQNWGEHNPTIRYWNAIGYKEPPLYFKPGIPPRYWAYAPVGHDLRCVQCAVFPRTGLFDQD